MTRKIKYLSIIASSMLLLTACGSSSSESTKDPKTNLELEKIEKQLTDKEQKLAQVQADLEVLKQEKQNEIKNLQEQVEIAKQTHQDPSAIEGELASIKSELSTIQSKLEATQNQDSSLIQTQLNKAKLDLKKIAKEKQALTESIEKQKDEVYTLKKKLAKAEQIGAETSKLKKQLKDKEDALKMSEDKLIKKEDALKKAQSNLKAKEKELKTSQDSLKEKEEALKVAQGKLKEKESALADVQEKLTKKEKELEEANKKLEELNTPKNIVLKTGQSTSYLDHDDGKLKKGEARDFSRHASLDIVIDNVNKLQWQDQSYHDALNTGYDVNINTENFGDYEYAKSYCSKLDLDGTGWRLPSIKELLSIVDFGNYRNTGNSYDDYDGDIYTTLSSVNHAAYDRGYWSSNERADATDPSFYRFDEYKGGSVSDTDKTDQLFIRCVREMLDYKAPVKSNCVRDDNTKTVTCKDTGLTWQDDEKASGDANFKNWDEAVAYCPTTLGDGWRLPNINELETIVDRSKVYPSIVGDGVFKNVSGAETDKSNNYWTSTSKAKDGTAAWYIGFGVGDISKGLKPNAEYYNDNYKYNVRCVKDAK